MTGKVGTDVGVRLPGWAGYKVTVDQVKDVAVYFGSGYLF
jgi:hypothetical protein